MANILHNFYRDITRKKTYESERIHDSQLKRCLTVFDLTILGRVQTSYVIRLITFYLHFSLQALDRRWERAPTFSLVKLHMIRPDLLSYLVFSLLLSHRFSLVSVMPSSAHEHHVLEVPTPTRTLVSVRSWRLSSVKGRKVSLKRVDFFSFRMEHDPRIRHR